MQTMTFRAQFRYNIKAKNQYCMGNVCVQLFSSEMSPLHIG